MTDIRRSAFVMVSAEHMFDVINAIEEYPSFVPTIRAAAVLEASANEVVGKLTFGKAGVQASLVTRNRLVRPHSVSISLERGPVDALTGQWRLKELDQNSCHVELHLNFSELTGLRGKIVGSLLYSLADSMVSAFVDRAQRLKG